MADVIRILLSLAVVVGGLLATRWLARRTRGTAKAGLRVVSRVAVTKTSSLLVVSVGRRMLLVGAAEGGLRLISELDPADVEPAETSAAAAAAPCEAAPTEAAPQPSSAAALPFAPTDLAISGPWKGLVRNLQRMTLRTAPAGPFHGRRG